MNYRFALLVFAFQITHVFTARFILRDSRPRMMRPRVVPIVPEKIDWYSGEVPWDFNDNSTSVRTKTKVDVPV
jgi:hypothetical protein